MLIEDQAHCFKPIGKMSIGQAQMECYEDFYDNMMRFAGKELDQNECSLENYNRFNSFCGTPIRYNNKNVQFTTFISRENSTELFYKMCESAKKCNKSESVEVKSIDQELKEKGMKRLCEDIEIKHFGDSIQVIPRYKAIFAPGEFPVLVFVVARIGNKEYFWYTIAR